MILSKSNLLASMVSAVQKIPLLNNVFVRKDGTTIASNGKVLIAVAPPNEKICKAYPIKDGKVNEEFLIGCESIGHVLKDIPRDTKFQGILEHCSVHLDGSDIHFKTTNGRVTRESNAKRLRLKWIDYKQILSRAMGKKSNVKIVLNKNRLLNLLTALDKICPDSSSFSPVFIEFTEGNDVVFRCIHPKTRQRAVGLMTSYKGTEGKWVGENRWERSLQNGYNEDRNSFFHDTRIDKPIVDPVNPRKKYKRTKIKKVRKI